MNGIKDNTGDCALPCNRRRSNFFALEEKTQVNDLCREGFCPPSHTIHFLSVMLLFRKNRRRQIWRIF